MSNAAAEQSLTKLTDTLRLQNSPELRDALLVEMDAYLEAGDKDAADEVARELAELRLPPPPKVPGFAAITRKAFSPMAVAQ